MEDQTKKLRYQKTLETRKATAEKRKSQTCRVFTFKINENKLSSTQKEQLKMIFVEAKWLYNDILNFSKDNPIWKYDTKTKELTTLNKNKEPKIRTLNFIGSSMKQAVHKQITSAIKSLATKKKQGKKVGNLKFTSEVSSINLKQYGSTHAILSKNRIRIQNISKPIKVNGLSQFNQIKGLEFANAKLLNTPNGYYVAITTFLDNDLIEPKQLIEEEIGIDMGIKDHITLSNGEKLNVTIGETERLKHLQRKFARSKKGSNNRYKLRKLIKKEYQKITNRKNDAANKVVAYLLSYQNVYMQDENISSWKKFNFGRQIQHSILGRVKAKLINHPRVNVIDRFAPTSKFCPICHNKKNDLKLSDRIYKCNICGYERDRDVHAANNMILMIKMVDTQLTVVPVGRREFKPVEIVNSSNIKELAIIEAGRSHSSECD